MGGQDLQLTVNHVTYQQSDVSVPSYGHVIGWRHHFQRQILLPETKVHCLFYSLDVLSLAWRIMIKQVRGSGPDPSWLTDALREDPR